MLNSKHIFFCSETERRALDSGFHYTGVGVFTDGVLFLRKIHALIHKLKQEFSKRRECS